MRKIAAASILVLLIVGIGIVPQRILTTAGRYDWVTPQSYTYTPTIDGNGVVEAGNSIKMVVGSNVIIKELAVADGSYVEAGDILALTELPQPQQTFLNQPLGSPAATLPESAGLQDLAAQYGLTLPAQEQEAMPSSTVAPAGNTTALQQAVAPISGVVTWENVSEGLFIAAGSGLCTILDTASYRAVVQVSAQEAALVQPGAHAVVTGSEIEDRQIAGTVLSVDNTVSRSVTANGYSATVQVTIALEAPAHTLRHGAGIGCTIDAGDTQQMVTLPYETIHQDSKNREFVYYVGATGLAKRYVSTGVELDSCIQILEGVAIGETVVTGVGDQPQDRYMLK